MPAMNIQIQLIYWQFYEIQEYLNLQQSAEGSYVCVCAYVLQRSAARIMNIGLTQVKQLEREETMMGISRDGVAVSGELSR